MQMEELLKAILTEIKGLRSDMREYHDFGIQQGQLLREQADAKMDGVMKMLPDSMKGMFKSPLAK
jgi:hypothetical protein